MEAIKPILESNDCTLTLSDEIVVLGEGTPITNVEKDSKGVEKNKLY
jgi:hypothetical protein